MPEFKKISNDQLEKQLPRLSIAAFEYPDQDYIDTCQKCGLIMWMCPCRKTGESDEELAAGSASWKRALTELLRAAAKEYQWPSTGPIGAALLELLIACDCEERSAEGIMEVELELLKDDLARAGFTKIVVDVGNE